MNTKITTFALLYATNQAWGLKVNENSNNEFVALENSPNAASTAIANPPGSQCRKSLFCSGYYKKPACTVIKQCSDDSEAEECDAIMSYGYKNIFSSSNLTPDYLADETAPGTKLLNTYILRSVDGHVTPTHNNIVIGQYGPRSIAYGTDDDVKRTGTAGAWIADLITSGLDPAENS